MHLNLQEELNLIKDTLYNIEAEKKLGSVVFDYRD